ncbi:MAG: type II toxin-antitoxin system RelE/ParE family toxin [Sulfuriferula sp.]
MKLVIVPLALTELHDAAVFYTEKSNVGLGLAFVGEFERTANLIFENPMLGAVLRGSHRRYFFRRFPYFVIYQVTARNFGSSLWRINGGDRIIGLSANSNPSLFININSPTHPAARPVRKVAQTALFAIP